MNKNIKKLLSLVLVVFISLITLNFKTNAANNYVKQEYYTMQAPSDYYNSVDLSKSSEEIMHTLYTIINDHKVYGYKSVTAVLPYTDPDPKNNGNIICFYTGESYSSGWNKEHVWAKSHGFPSDSSTPYSDIHHLRPTLISINESRSNYDYAELKGTAGAKTDGKGNYWDSSKKLFEPRDEVKGDCARILFYMATCYSEQSPYNLKLVDDLTTGSTSGNGRFGNLQTLLKWHYQDPVSKEEIYRNNAIYNDYQHNRNPYIDHPEYVDYVYPNSYSKQTVDEQKVNNVIEKIKTIPATVTLENKELVNEIKEAYNALNGAERAKVTNYNILSTALDTIRKLENGNKGDDSFNSAISVNTPTELFNYTANKTFKCDGKYEFLCSYAGCYNDSGVLRLGYNKAGAEIDEKFGLTEKEGVSMEMKFDVENANAFEVISSCEYPIDKWYIMFSSDEGKTWKVVQSGNPNAESKQAHTYKGVLEEGETGRFALVLVGSNKPRTEIKTINIGVDENANKTIVDLSKVTTNANLTINYEVKENVISSVNATINIIGHIKKSGYSADTKYGVLYLEKTQEDVLYKEKYTTGSISEFAKSINAIYVELDSSLSDNGYTLKAPITVDKAKEYVYVIVCEYDGNVYFANQSTFKIVDMVNYYLTNNFYKDDKQKEALNAFLK